MNSYKKCAVARGNRELQLVYGFILLACCVWQTWTSVESRAPAVSRTAPTTPEVTSATALQDTDSTQTAVAATVREAIHTFLFLSLSCIHQRKHSHFFRYRYLIWELFGCFPPLFSVSDCVYVRCRCGRVSGCQRRLWSHVPEQRGFLSVFLSPGFPSGWGPTVLHP